jgi:hypothetical protein
MPKKKYYPGYQYGGGIKGLQEGGMSSRDMGDLIWENNYNRSDFERTPEGKYRFTKDAKNRYKISSPRRPPPVPKGWGREEIVDHFADYENRMPKGWGREEIIDHYADYSRPTARRRPPSKVMRGLGRLAKFAPAGLLIDQLMSPELAGAAEVPERPRHSDEERQRAMASMMEGGDQLRDLLSPRPERPASFSDVLHGRQEGGLIPENMQRELLKLRMDGSISEEQYSSVLRRMREDLGRASGGIVGLQMGGPSGTQVTQSYVAPEVSQQYANLTDRIVQEGQRPYQQYGGQRLAGFTAPEAAAMAGTVAYGQGAGPQGTLQAGQTLGQAGQMIGGAYQGMAGLQPQYAQMAGQMGQAAQGALGQAQAGAQGMQQLAGRAELQGQLAGAGMRQTGAAAQAEQQQLGAQQETRGRIAQTQMQGLGQQAQQAGQGALGAQQGYAAGMAGLGAQAGAQGQAGQAQFGALGQAAGQLGQTAMGQMGQTGQQSQQQAQQAAERMRQIGGQAPQLQKGADMSDYMSQYTKGVTDPQLQQLMEFQKMQGQELGSQAAGAGAFGGLRQGVQATEQAKAASEQAAGIIGAGQQKAFESAQQAFQADRAAQQQAQQTGLSAEGQAAQTQAGAQGQALAAQQAGVGAAQAGGAQQLQAAQQGQAAGQAGTAAQMQAQQQAAGMADVGAGRQMQGLQAQAGATAQGIGMGQQGLAAQQAAATQGAQFGMQGQQQGFNAAQQGISTGLAGLQGAGQLGQQGYGTMGQLMGQQQGAIGAQGQAFGQMGQMGGQMAGLGGRQQQLGQQQQAQQLQRLQAMQGAGAAQRGLQQQGLNMGYQDFQNQQNQNRQNINWQMGAMGQLPYQSTVSTSMYQPQPTGTNAMIGAGLQGLDVYNTMNNRGNQAATTGTPAP